MSIRVFCSVAEQRSFSAAAERLGISPAMASKHVMHLERRLSTRLLNRTSRHVSLTEAGALYLEQARQTMDALDEVEAAVGKATVVPHGVLRLSAPVWLANPVFVSILADYRARYPLVRLDIDLSGRLVNLVDEGFDLALRATGALQDDLVARRLCDIRFHLVAAPAYLDRSGRPTSVADLDGHALLVYALLPSGGTFPIKDSQGEHTVRFDPVLRSANETLLHLAALEGMGMAFLPRWLIAEDLENKRLEMVLSTQAGMSAQLYGVYPSRKYLSAKVRTFLDFLAADPRLR